MARVSATESGSPTPDRVRAHQVDLQLANLVAGDAHVAEFAHARGDGIGEFVAGDDVVNHGARTIHGLARVGRQAAPGVVSVRDFAHRFQSKIVTVDVKCVQEKFPVSLSSIERIFPCCAECFQILFRQRGTFISGSVTMCVVSPSASSAPSSARTQFVTKMDHRLAYIQQLVRTRTSSS